MRSLRAVRDANSAGQSRTAHLCVRLRFLRTIVGLIRGLYLPLVVVEIMSGPAPTSREVDQVENCCELRTRITCSHVHLCSKISVVTFVIWHQKVLALCRGSPNTTSPGMWLLSGCHNSPIESSWLRMLDTFQLWNLKHARNVSIDMSKERAAVLSLLWSMVVVCCIMKVHIEF